ncbi:MAG: hypothetical protein ACREV6_09195 [Clostridium sp.]
MNDNLTLAKKRVSDFEETLVSDGKVPKTIESYTGDIRAFLDCFRV